MYRQFLVSEEDRAYQNILWRDTKEQLKKYQLNTITFGLSGAPYLAIRCLKQLAQDEGHRFPKAAEILQRDFYVDDALTGAPTRKEAFALREELTQILQTAGLKIRQWASNDPSLLRDLPPDAINEKLYLGDSSTLKTLGIVWDATRDLIQYSVKTTTPPSRITKRYICSEIAKIYDPLGLLGSSYHQGETAPPKNVGHEARLGQVIADGYSLRMGAILRRTTSAQQCDFQSEHNHQGRHRDSASWILRCK
mgnify:CR=1 FL=1